MFSVPEIFVFLHFNETEIVKLFFSYSAAVVLDDIGIATGSIWWVINLSHAFYQSCCNLRSRRAFNLGISGKSISALDSLAERLRLQAAVGEHDVRVSARSITLVGGELFVACPIAG